MVEQLVYLIFYIIILGVIFWLLNYVVDMIVPQPFHKVAKVLIVVVACLILILLLLQLISGGGIPSLKLG